MNEAMMEGAQDWYNEQVAMDDSVINIDDLNTYLLESFVWDEMTLAELMSIKNILNKSIEKRIEELKQK